MIGRWRKDSFNSISAIADQSYETAIYPTLLDSLHTLLNSCFDSSAEAKLDEEHEAMLRRLVDVAERWNRLIKGNVVLLGEFQPIAYPCGDGFQSNHMSRVTDSGAERTQSILGTVELGLIKYIALGNNQEPEETILHHAAVVSEKSFA